MARLAPLLAMFCGHPQLMQYVEYTTRVTQNSDAAVAWGCTGAAVLERILHGHTAQQAVEETIRELEAENGRVSCAETC